MIGPFVRLRPGITADDARRVAAWLEDSETVLHLSDAPGVSPAIRRALSCAGMGVVTHLFNQGERFLIAEENNEPVGFVRLASGPGETQIVLLVERSRWDRYLGGA
jgi:regulator of nucleoside diphosphate kinase